MRLRAILLSLMSFYSSVHGTAPSEGVVRNPAMISVRRHGVSILPNAREGQYCALHHAMATFPPKRRCSQASARYHGCPREPSCCAATAYRCGMPAAGTWSEAAKTFTRPKTQKWVSDIDTSTNFAIATCYSLTALASHVPCHGVPAVPYRAGPSAQGFAR